MRCAAARRRRVGFNSAPRSTTSASAPCSARANVADADSLATQLNVVDPEIVGGARRVHAPGQSEDLSCRHGGPSLSPTTGLREGVELEAMLLPVRREGKVCAKVIVTLLAHAS